MALIPLRMNSPMMPPRAAIPGSSMPCYRFSAYRAEDGRWTLSQREMDFAMVFPDLAAAVAFADSFCQGSSATIALRTGRQGAFQIRPLSALLDLSATELEDLLQPREPDGTAG